MSQMNVIVFTLLALGTSQVSATDISIKPSGNQFILNWPLTATNDFYLQTTASLAQPVTWNNASDPTTNGTSFVCIDDGSGTNRFFKLKAWEILFDGTSTAAFRGYQQADFPDTNHWAVTTNGELMAAVDATRLLLTTRNQYGSYELRWEWKTSSKGNSGVQYRASDASTGPEYQLLDDLAYSVPANNTMGAVWGLFAPTNKVRVPVGQWNVCRLILRGNHVQHWLNGSKVVEYDINSAAWTNALIAGGSSFSVPGFGQGTSPGVGYILLRNDTGPTWFRNIKIRQLPSQ